MQILADIFPAHFSAAPAGALPDVFQLNPISHVTNTFYVSTTRVIVSETHVTVASDAPDGPQIVFHEPYLSFFKAESQTGVYRVLTTSGKMLAFQKDTSCGCGSRLRAWNPYKTLSSIFDPKE
jgi:hypothetical protein